MANRSDDFNRADSNTTLDPPSDGLGNYTATGNTAGIQSNRAYCVSGGEVHRTFSVSTDCEVTAKIYGATFTAVIARLSNSTNKLQFFKSAAGNLRYQRIVGGVGGDQRDFPSTINDGDTITIRCSGDTIVLKHNGNQLDSFTESNLNSNTHYGIGFLNGSSSGTIDDLSVTDLVSSMAIDRNNVLCGSGTVTVSITGSGTSWTGGTTFVLASEPTGWSISSQNVISGTSATVTLNKGSGTGAFTIGDGTITDSITATNTATSAGSGAWATAATWDVIEEPVSGNLVSIVSPHAITVAGSRACGNSPAESNVVLTVANGASLTVNDGATLTVKGEISYGGTIQVGEATGGGILEMDASGAASPSSQQYKILATHASAMFKTRGLEADPTIVRSNAGGGNAYFSASNDCGLYDCEWADFLRIGDATFNAIELVRPGDPGSDVVFITLTDVTFTDCGRFHCANALHADAELLFTRVVWTNTQHATECARFASTGARGTGVTRVVNLCGFDKLVAFTIGGFTFTQCIFDNEYGTNETGTWADGDFDNCFVRLTATSGNGLVGMALYGSASDWFVLADGGTDNPHIILPRDTGASETFADSICEYTKGTLTDNGNWFYAADTCDWTLTGCITIPGQTEPSPGAVTFSQPSCNVLRNTFYSPYYAGGILIGDGSATTGTHPEVKSNIFWVKNSASDGTAITAIGAAVTTDNVVTPGGCTHNGLLNMVTPAYEGDYPTTQPGANDVRLDSTDETTVFVDPARNIATWATSRGATGTYAEKVVEARTFLREDPTLLQDLLEYIRYGFRVQYSAWRTASHTGNVVGAVQDEPEEGEAALFWWGNYGNACY